MGGEAGPRCPHCDEVLIEGECIAHGVIAGQASPPAAETAEQRSRSGPSTDAQPKERARMVTPEGGGPAYVVFEPESVARAREREHAQRPAAQGPTAAEPVGPPPKPGSQDTIVIDQRPVWIAAVAAAVLLVFVLFSLWRGQASLSRRVDTVRNAIASVEERLTGLNAAAIEAGARLRRVERQLGDTINVARLARQIRPSVLTVSTDAGIGSAFVVARGGGRTTLLTNLHVVADAGPNGRVSVTQRGMRALTGRVERIDPQHDLATITVGRRLPVLQVQQRLPAAGAPVIVVGSPLGLDGTISEGIVSGRVQGLIQFSAAASPGSSGGPLVNANGRVIGVVTLKLIGPGTEGLNFAVPISRACSVVLSC